MAEPASCLECRAELDARTLAGELGREGAIVGDVSICAYCGAAAIFTGHGLELRAPTPAELAELEADPTVAAARRRLGRTRHRLRGYRPT